MAQTNNFNKYATLVLPSAASLITGAVVMAAVIVTRLSSVIRQQIGVPSGIDINGLMSSSVEKLLNHSFGQNLTDTAVVAGFWAAVGLVIYAVVLIVSRMAREAGEDIYEEKRYLWPRGVDRQAPVKEFVLKLIIRLLAVIGAVLYIFIPLGLIMHAPPFNRVAGQGAPVDQLTTILLWFAVGLLVWHGLVVLLRLAALRSRLLG